MQSQNLGVGYGMSDTQLSSVLKILVQRSTGLS